LLSAIGHEVIVNDPNKVVVYLTAEMFVNEYVAAIKKMQLDRFKQKYRSADVLLVDDIQMLEGKTKSQEEFFNVFNTLHNAGKQIVVTSDRPPAELTEIMDRLRSRLTWGLVAEIEQPSYESRLAILKSKTQERRAILDPEVLDFIAMNVSDSVRALEGVLVRALAEADLLHTQPTVRSLAKLLTKLNKKERVLGVPEAASAIKIRTAAEMIQFVADYFQLDKAVLTGTSREKAIKTARQIAMYLMRDLLGLGLEAIATEFAKNNATVLHSVRKIQADLKTDSALVRQVNGVKQELGL
jgi:chromosomal replication initiator protein